ncbi:MAG TPA: mechanosensitive ion channel domain-containing protein [Puia sp.]|nr:mechanosensitive ion channel domain-containing protein [Puia sp.]
MNGFWNRLIFDNPVKSFLFVVIAIGTALLIKRIMSRYIAGQLYRLASTLDPGIDKKPFVKLMLAPVETFLVTFISIAAIEKLRFPGALEFEIYEVSSRVIIHSVAKTVLIAMFIWLLLRIIDFVALLLKRKSLASGGQKDQQMVVFFRDFLKVILVIIGILMIFSISFGFEVSKLWTGLGIAGAALALATKESIENLIASFIIFFDKPFQTGDVLKVSNVTGTVEKIGLRSTRIRTDQKTYVTVPNKQMVDSIVDNQTLRTQRKAEIRLQLDSSTPPDIIQQFIDESRNLLNKTYIDNPTVYLVDISGTAFQLNIDYFTPPITVADFNGIKQKVNLEILKLLETLKIPLSGTSTTVKIVGEGKLKI